MFSLPTLALYPWLKDSKEWVRKEAPKLEELLKSPTYERARAIGHERLLNALERKDIGERSLSTEAEQIMELLSYPLARMIAVGTMDPSLSFRYALAEAKHASRLLMSEPLEFVLEMCKEFGLDIRLEGEKFKLHFTDWIKYAPTYDSRWKLVNNRVDGGYVVSWKRGIVRLLQEALTRRISNEIRLLAPPREVQRVFGKQIKEIKANYSRPEETLGKEGTGDFPPCIKKIISTVTSGMNVSHEARFALVTFLHAIGKSEPDILKHFSRAPDFDLEKTQYQVRHITGDISGTEYKPPSCQKLKTFGICPESEMDELCSQVRHPLTYYKRSQR
ncbi:MAG TPA: DNA primase large subunit PriL [Thermoplasmata archaeon]|nr:DNA primase large subunit PriL [Thermoplasmata archaeon]